MAAIYSDGGNRAGILLASILLKEMRYLVHVYKISMTKTASYTHIFDNIRRQYKKISEELRQLLLTYI